MGYSSITRSALDKITLREGHNFSSNPRVDIVVAGTKEALKDIFEMEKFEKIEDILPTDSSGKCQLYELTNGKFSWRNEKAQVLGKNIDFGNQDIQQKYKRFAERFEVLNSKNANTDEYKKLEKLLAMRLFFDYCNDKKIVIDQSKINLKRDEKDFTGTTTKELRNASFKDSAGNLYDQKTPPYDLYLVGIHETRTNPQHPSSGPTYTIYARSDYIKKLEREKNKFLGKQENNFQAERKNSMKDKATLSTFTNFVNRDVTATKVEAILDWTGNTIKEQDSIELRTGSNPKSIKFEDLPDNLKNYFRNEFNTILSIQDPAKQEEKKKELATQIAEALILHAGLEIQISNDTIRHDNSNHRTYGENKEEADKCLRGLMSLKSSMGRSDTDLPDVEVVEYPAMRIVNKLDEEIFALEEEKKNNPTAFNAAGKQAILDAKIKQRKDLFDMREKKKELDAIIADSTKTPQEIQRAKDERKELLEKVYKPALEAELDYRKKIINNPTSLGLTTGPNNTEKEIIRQKIDDIEKHLKQVEDAIKNPDDEAKNGNTKIPKRQGSKSFHEELMSAKFFEIHHVVRKKNPASMVSMALNLDSIEAGLTIQGSTIDIHNDPGKGGKTKTGWRKKTETDWQKTETILGQYVQEAVGEESREKKEKILGTKLLIPRVAKLLRYNFTDNLNKDRKIDRAIKKLGEKDNIIKDNKELQERGEGVARIAREGDGMIGNGVDEGFEKVGEVSGEILDELAEDYANNPNDKTLENIKNTINQYYKQGKPPFDEIKKAYGINGTNDNDAVLDILDQIKEQAISKKAFADLLNAIEEGRGREGLKSYISVYGIPSFILGFARTKTGNPNLKSDDIQEGINFVNKLSGNEIEQIKLTIKNNSALDRLRKTTTRKFGPKIKISVYKHNHIGPVGGISMKDHFGKTFAKKELLWRGGVTAAGIAIKALLGASCPLFWVAAGVGMAHVGIGLLKKNYEIGQEFKDLYNKVASGLVIDENYIENLKRERDKVSFFWKVVGITMGWGKRASLNDRVQIAKYVRGKYGENQVVSSDMIKGSSDTAKYHKIDIQSRINELKNDTPRQEVLIYDTLARFEAQVTLKKDFFSSAMNQTATMQRAELIKELRDCILRQLDPTNTNRCVLKDGNGNDINATEEDLEIMKNPAHPDYQTKWKDFIEKIKSADAYKEYVNALLVGDGDFMRRYKIKKGINLGIDATRGMVKVGVALALGSLINKGLERITSKTEHIPGVHVEHYKDNPLVDSNNIGEFDVSQNVINDIHSKLTNVPDNSTIKFKIGTGTDRRWASTNGNFSDTITEANINDTIDFVKTNAGPGKAFDENWAKGFEESYRNLMEQVKQEAIQNGVKEGNINLAQQRVNELYRKVLEEAVHSGGKGLRVEGQFDPSLCNFQASHHVNPGIPDNLADQARTAKLANLTISKPGEVHHIPGVQTETGHVIPLTTSGMDSSSFRGSPNDNITNPNTNNPNNPNVTSRIK